MKARKILSALLAAVMLLSICVTGVAAEDTLPFTDVPEGEWYYDAVAYTYAAGLMNGTGTGSTFSPMVNLTRGMVVTVLFRNDGSPSNAYPNRFVDVSDDAYYAKAAAWAFGEGVVTGTGEDEWGDPLFSPDRNITRQELAAMFARYAAYRHVDTTKNTASLDSFSDASNVASWAEKEFKWTAGTGIITGKANGGATTLAPTDLATRAEFAIMIQRYNVKDDAREFTYFLAYETPVLKSKYTEPEYPLVKDADIYVAVDGNDNNDGTFEKPLATFAEAKKRVADKLKTATKDIKVAFMGGDYGALDNLTFTAEDSGNDKVTVIYCAYGDSPVYFTNGIFINSGDFTALDESEKYMFNPDAVADIKKVDLSDHPASADVTAFTSLSHSTGFCWQARTPNKINGIDQYYTGCTVNVVTPDSPYTLEEIQAEATKNGYLNEHTIIRPYTEQKKLQAVRSLKPRMDAYHTYENVQVCGYVSKVWHSDALNVTDYNNSTGVISFSNEPQYGFVNVDAVQQAYVNNVSEELDDAGEYWVDPTTKTLYVYKPQGNYNMATKGTFLTVERNVNYITLKKLNFRICDANGIVVYGDNFTFDQSSLTYVGGGRYGFRTAYGLNLVITNSTFAYCAETAVYTEGPGPDSRSDYDYYALQSTGFVFKNNLIHDVDLVRVPVESGGLKIEYHVGADVSHNEIYNSARYGIDYKYGNIDCIFEYNYLHHCMQNSADGGAFYCGRVAFNRGNVIRYNVVADIYALNRMHTGGTYSIYLDDGMENLICYGNVFYNAGTIMNNGGRAHEIYDNVFIGESSGIIGKDPIILDIKDYATQDRFNEGWNNLDRIPDENTPAGQIWKAKWPDLYDIVAICKNPSIDVTKLGLYSKDLNECYNNYHFDEASSSFSDNWEKLSRHENNLEFPADENPFFADPTHGDYSIADTSKFADNHFDMIGRY